MKNWMTSIAGLASAGASYILFAQPLGYLNPPHWLLGLAFFVQIGGLAALGITAKQYNVTGGTVPQTPEAAVRTGTPEAKVNS